MVVEVVALVVVVMTVVVDAVVVVGVNVEIVVLIKFLSMIIQDPPINTGIMTKINQANIAIEKTIVKV